MLTPDHEDMLSELVNIGIGRAAYTLSEMVRSHVGLRVPSVAVDPPTSTRDRATAGALDPASVVLQAFSGGVTGTASLAIPLASARKLVAVLTEAETESPDIDVEREGVLTEVGNIVINSVLGSLGNLAALDLTFGLPRYVERADTGASPAVGSSSLVVSVLFQIQRHAIEGELSVVFDSTVTGGTWATLLDPDRLQVQA